MIGLRLIERPSGGVLHCLVEVEEVEEQERVLVVEVVAGTRVVVGEEVLWIGANILRRVFTNMPKKIWILG